MKRRLRLLGLRAGLAGVVALCLLNVAAGSVSAGTGSRRDADDTAGRLDIATIAHGHDGRRLVHTVRTYGNWGHRHLRGNNRFLVVAKEDGDVGRLRVWWRRGGWWCAMSSPQRSSHCSDMPVVSVAHPDRRTLVIMSRRPAHWEGRYGWRAASRHPRTRRLGAPARQVVRPQAVTSAPGTAHTTSEVHWTSQVHWTLSDVQGAPA